MKTKALYQIFDNMVTKGAIKISDLGTIDSKFKNIPKIKAALDAEVAKPSEKPAAADRLLYQGILKQSINDGILYMRHLDALNNYLIMGNNPAKEITEHDRMFILVENRTSQQKLTITFATTPITSEDTYFTTSLNQTATDTKIEKIKADLGQPPKKRHHAGSPG